MKKLSAFVWMLCLPITGFSDGLIAFRNGVPSPVTTSDGVRVPAGNTFSVGLYYAPDGVLNEAGYRQIAGPIGFVTPGFFNGSGVITPAPANGYAMFQIRVWETAFGGSYEEAAAGFALGQPVRFGKSNLVRAFASDPYVVPPLPPGQLTGLQPIVLVPEPQSWLLVALSLVICFGVLKRRNNSAR